MKKFILKDVVVDLKLGKVDVYYTGKDGYVHDESTFYFCDGYSQKRFLEQKIQKDVKWHSRNNEKYAIDEYHVIESGRWLHSYSIMEVSK